MKFLLLIVLSFLASLTQLTGQIIADSISFGVELVNNANVQALRTDVETTFEEIKNSNLWKPYDSTYISSPQAAIWLKFELENSSRDTLHNFIYSNINYVTTYQKTDLGLEISKNGTLLPLPQRTNKSEYQYTKLTVFPFKKSSIYVRLYNSSIGYNPGHPLLYSEMGYYKQSNQIRERHLKPIGFIYFNIISLITIFIFSLVFWLRLREKMYLYYLGYLFFLLVYGFQALRTTGATVGNLFVYIPKLSNLSFEPVQFIFIGFYVLFISHLLTVKKYDKILAKVLTYLAISCFVYAVGRFIFSYFFFGLMFSESLFLIVRSIILPLNFVLIFWIIFKVKHPLLIYFIIGQSFLFLGAILASYIEYSDFHLVRGHFFNFKQAPNIVFQIGLLAEVYCFSLALGQNIFILQREKEKATVALIAQLKENQLIQKTMNRELDEKINKKTSELIQLYSQLEIDKEDKIKSAFSQKLKETEMVALRSQMNPHFIFNSLSAIKHLIMTSRNDDAIIYLDDFSTLLRGILQNSNRKKITVEEELEILEVYLSLEKNRMGSDFKYNIQVSSREALSQFHIPPLLLQPIVENALLHGLQPSLKTNKELTVIFDTTENLKIIIEDNGIGRKESAKKKKLHHSMGTSIVQDRLTLFNHLNDHDIQLKVTDLEEDGNVLGTRITLTHQHWSYDKNNYN